MKFLVDAQLPRRISLKLAELGHDSVHTLELPQGNETSDDEICLIADSDKRIVVTKDSDFVDSFLLHTTPKKLLLISTGNIGNNDLLDLLVNSIETIEDQFTENDFLELSRTSVITHD